MNLQDAAEEVRTLLRKFKAVEMVADAIERIGQLEQFEKEVVARIELARAHEMAAHADTAEAEARAKAAAAKGPELVANAEVQAKVIVETAQCQAAETRAKAAAVTADAKDVVAAAEQMVAAQRREAEAAKRELLVLTKQIEDAKAQIKKMLGV